MIGMDYYYADQKAQCPYDNENAFAIKNLIDNGFLNSILLSQDVFIKMMLKNKLALITGANRGIGLSILKKFSKNGADIIACARNRDSKFEQLISDNILISRMDSGTNFAGVLI